MQSGLEPKSIRSRTFGLFTWAICELMNAGGKKIDETIPMITTDYLYQHCASKHSLRTEMKLSFHAFQVERQFSSERANLGIRLINVYLFRMRRPLYENKMHVKGTKQVRESAAVSDCMKIHAHERSESPSIRKLSAYEIFWIYGNFVLKLAISDSGLHFWSTKQ